MAGVFSCGLLGISENRAAAKTLIELGSSAAREVEDAIDSLETMGRRSEFIINAEWLLLVYARFKGPDAYPRLRRMSDDPRLEFIQGALWGPVASSLSLTSYVSSSRYLGRVFRCHRGPEPRDPLDQLILAWQRNDRPWLEASLGANARAALDSLLADRSWADMRAELWAEQPSNDVAVGYRFDIPGRWSDPEESRIEEHEDSEPVITLLKESSFFLDTQFADREGRPCGKRRVKFSSPDPFSFLVDNSDLEDLLRTIAACAVN